MKRHLTLATLSLLALGSVTVRAEEMHGDRKIAMMTEKLKLTPEQQSAIKAIMDETDTKIQAVLTDEQKKKFAEMKEHRKERMEERREHREDRKDMKK
jgi:Spy/CpxP family protein refolding chaperone